MHLFTPASLHLMRDLLPDLSYIMLNRTVNYLSFYNSYHGHHQYYSPYLYSHQYLQAYFEQRSTEPQMVNYQHVMTKVILGCNFHQHVVDAKGTFRMLADLYTMTTAKKQDIVEGLLKVKCRQIYQNQPIEPTEKLLPFQKRRNFYVVYPQSLPSPQQLTHLITLNPFYRLPNLNKIIVFTSNPKQPLHLTPQLQTYCLHNGIKIKLLDAVPRQQSEQLIEYLYHKDKSKILIHQNINFQKAIYDVPNSPERLKTVKGKVINPLNTKLMPQEIVIMTQRLPVSSLAITTTKQEILEKTRNLLSLDPSEDLIDPSNRIAMSTIQKNYQHQEQTHFQQSKFGFLTRRYVTSEVYQLHRKSQINTPFTNPKP